jgi:glucose-6-phosphate-specific signal transduction histidine kinase
MVIKKSKCTASTGPCDHCKIQRLRVENQRLQNEVERLYVLARRLIRERNQYEIETREINDENPI